MVFVHHEPPYLCIQVCHQQHAKIDMNPSNDISIRKFCDVDRVAFILLNALQAPLGLFPRDRVTQLMTEYSDTPGILWTCKAYSSLAVIAGFSHHSPALSVLLGFSVADAPHARYPYLPYSDTCRP
jgi:hypothetical protein